MNRDERSCAPARPVSLADGRPPPFSRMSIYGRRSLDKNLTDCTRKDRSQPEAAQRSSQRIPRKPVPSEAIDFSVSSSQPRDRGSNPRTGIPSENRRPILRNSEIWVPKIGESPRQSVTLFRGSEGLPPTIRDLSSENRRHSHPLLVAGGCGQGPTFPCFACDGHHSPLPLIAVVFLARRHQEAGEGIQTRCLRAHGRRVHRQSDPTC